MDPFLDCVDVTNYSAWKRGFIISFKQKKPQTFPTLFWEIIKKEKNSVHQQLV